MNNRVRLKRLLIVIGIVSILFICLFSFINVRLYNEYCYNYNVKLNRLVSNVHEEYDVDTNDIIKMLNDDNDKEYLNKYGIDLSNKSILNSNNKLFSNGIVINILLVICFVLILVIILLRYDNKKTKDINDITRYIEELNRKNYILDIDNNSEDELSILKNEIYKITILLKEDAENSKNEKLELKKSLEDISHQLKTPLTSILIILDNLIDDPDMDKEIRDDFVKDIRREISNINFLVQSLLKLSKLDTNTVNFNISNCSLLDIVNESIRNVSLLADLMEVSINVNVVNDCYIDCDKKWEIEAITNVLKNSVEHTNSKVDILIDCNKVYSLIKIKDNGNGISKKDLKNIFKRFYKGSNAKVDSIGIGLALAKSIIEKDNGSISVDSSSNGTVFSIKYY